MVSCFQDIWFHFNHFVKDSNIREYIMQIVVWFVSFLSTIWFTMWTLVAISIVVWSVHVNGIKRHLSGISYCIVFFHDDITLVYIFTKVVPTLRRQNTKLKNSSLKIYFTTIFCFITLCQAMPQKVKTVLYFYMRLRKISNDNFCQARNCAVCWRLYVVIESSQGLQ